jgi:hypothetical protein
MDFQSRGGSEQVRKKSGSAKPGQQTRRLEGWKLFSDEVFLIPNHRFECGRAGPRGRIVYARFHLGILVNVCTKRHWTLGWSSRSFSRSKGEGASATKWPRSTGAD